MDSSTILYLQDEAKLDAVITILKSIDNIDNIDNIRIEQSPKMKELKSIITTPEKNTTITTRMLFDAWKMADFRAGFHDPVHHVNGFIFAFNRFRVGISHEDYINKTGRVSMFIYISKDILESIRNDNKHMTQKEITDTNRRCDRIFGSTKPFWQYSKLKFIDFDDCWIHNLQPFLEWCDNHKAEELLQFIDFDEKITIVHY